MVSLVNVMHSIYKVTEAYTRSCKINETYPRSKYNAKTGGIKAHDSEDKAYKRKQMIPNIIFHQTLQIIMGSEGLEPPTDRL